MRRSLTALLGVPISGLALYVVLQTIDVGEAVGIIADADLLPLLAIVGIVAVQMVIRAWRWSFLLPRRKDRGRYSVSRLLPPLLVGYLGNSVLPARLGEIIRAVVLSRRERIGTAEVLGSVLLERVIDVATLALVAFGAALTVHAPTWATQSLGFAAAGSAVGLALLVTVGIQPVLRLADRFRPARRSGRIRELVDRFANAVGGPSRRRPIAISATASIGAWLLDAVSFWLAAAAVGVDLPYAGALLVGGITVLGTALPSAPGYVGTFELAAAATAGVLGVEPAPALAMAVIVHVMTLAPMALGGALSLPLIGTSLGSVAREATAEAGAESAPSPRSSIAASETP